MMTPEPNHRATPEDRWAATADLSWMLWTAIGIGGIWAVVASTDGSMPAGAMVAWLRHPEGPGTWTGWSRKEHPVASTPPDGAQPPPTLFAWAGGAEAWSRLTRIFYGHVKDDPILAPVFAEMHPEHPQWVAQWLGEVFGGPATYTQERGGYPHMLSRHLGRALTEPQRARWVRLLGEAADEAGLPADPEFRSAFVSYLEWGSRIALANSQPGAQPPPRMPVPHWDWGPAGPPSAAVGPVPPPSVARAGGSEHSAAVVTGPPSFARDIRPLFTDRDRAAMRWAFDLGDVAAVREHAAAILDQLAAGRMPCYGAWPAEQVSLFRQWIHSGKLD